MAYQVQCVCSDCGRLLISDAYDGLCPTCRASSKYEECEACKTMDILNENGLCRTCAMRYRDNGGCCDRYERK